MKAQGRVHVYTESHVPADCSERVEKEQWRIATFPHSQKEILLSGVILNHLGAISDGSFSSDPVRACSLTNIKPSLSEPTLLVSSQFLQLHTLFFLLPGL
ncbi:hypothetical protein K1719_039961 [Acacia pycnantha]|nr:hypothetical protein K1719_039961 [Acacia pycnantha]